MYYTVRLKLSTQMLPMFGGGEGVAVLALHDISVALSESEFIEEPACSIVSIAIFGCS